VRPADVLIRAGELASAGEPFALATVVNVRRPASARRGDRAVVTADGAVYGWVGGSCSEPAVVREALAALGDGESRLISTEGSCASKGAVEILVEAQLPAPLLAIIGESPAAETLARLAVGIDWRVTRELHEDSDAVVVATMGRGDEEALAAALAGPAGYVGLVASRKRADSRRTRSRGSRHPRASTSGQSGRRRSQSRSSPSSSPGAMPAHLPHRRPRRRSIRSAG
jgi:xanthine dehydrogenase accessory factor